MNFDLTKGPFIQEMLRAMQLLDENKNQTERTVVLKKVKPNLSKLLRQHI
jgi:hypothetical protein